MKAKFVHAALVSAVVIGMAGCASISQEEYEQLKSDLSAASAKADEAAQTATDANASSMDARRIAEEARDTANEAKSMARDALDQAGTAKSMADETAEKTERMFKKSMSK
jgi:hypothetical protein